MSRNRRITLLLALLLPVFAWAALTYPGYFELDHGFRPIFNLTDLARNLPGIGWAPAVGQPYDLLRGEGALAYWLALLPRALGASSATAVKWVFGASFILGALGMYAWARRTLGDWPGLLAATIYALWPIGLATVYVRGALAEAVFAGVLPWLIWLAAERGWRWRGPALIVGLAAAMWIQAGLALWLAVVLLALILSVPLPWQGGGRGVGAAWPVAAGVALGLLGLLPVALRHGLAGKTYAVFADHFVFPHQLLLAGWGAGPSVAGPADVLTFQLGLIACGLAVLGLALPGVARSETGHSKARSDASAARPVFPGAGHSKTETRHSEAEVARSETGHSKTRSDASAARPVFPGAGHSKTETRHSEAEVARSETGHSKARSDASAARPVFPGAGHSKIETRHSEAEVARSETGHSKTRSDASAARPVFPGAGHSKKVARSETGHSTEDSGHSRSHYAIRNTQYATRNTQHATRNTRRFALAAVLILVLLSTTLAAPLWRLLAPLQGTLTYPWQLLLLVGPWLAWLAGLGGKALLELLPADGREAAAPLVTACLVALTLLGSYGYLTPAPAAVAVADAPLAIFGEDEIALLDARPVILPARGATPPILQAGATISVTAHWQALRPLERDYTVFLHATDPSGQLQGQQDTMPQDNKLPTSRWRPGQIVADQYHATLKPSAPSGEGYTVALGLYQWQTGQRLRAGADDKVTVKP